MHGKDERGDRRLKGSRERSRVNLQAPVVILSSLFILFEGIRSTICDVRRFDIDVESLATLALWDCFHLATRLVRNEERIKRWEKGGSDRFAGVRLGDSVEAP